MTKNINLLLIEDNVKLAQLIIRFTKIHNITVTHVQFASDLANINFGIDFDIVICDVMLPDDSGFNLIPAIQNITLAPVIFLTALSSAADHIQGLELGAVDYIVKPVEPSVLVARIKTALRITPSALDNEKQSSKKSPISIGGLHLDQEAEIAIYDSETLPFTHNEFELLWVFAKNVNKLLTREFIFSQVMNREYNGLDRTIDARTMRLRKKLADLNLPGISIRTVWGKGYILNDPM